jgi:VWFA-related protein
VLALAACVASLPPSSRAATPVRVRVDTVAWPTVAVSVVLPHVSNSPHRLFENGRRVPLLYATNVGRSHSFVLAVDNSQSMHGASLRSAIGIARRLVADKAPNDRAAIFAIGSKSVQLTPFTTSSKVLDAALHRIRLDTDYGTALYDGVARAAGALHTQHARDKVLLLVTDGQETTSNKPVGTAAAVAAQNQVAVYPIAVPNVTYQPGTLDTLARATRGAFFGASTRSASSDYAAIASDVRRTWRIDYITSAQPGSSATLRIAQRGSPPETTTFTIPGDPHRPTSSISRNRILYASLAALGAIVILVLLLKSRPNARNRRR